jgi:hypothetical protein
MQVTQEIRDAVTLGAALMDANNHPSWRRKCDGMDIADPFNCILTRVYGCFIKGSKALGIAGISSRYGFDASSQMIGEYGLHKYFAMLQQAWEDEFANPPLGTDDDE